MLDGAARNLQLQLLALRHFAFRCRLACSRTQHFEDETRTSFAAKVTTDVVDVPGCHILTVNAQDDITTTGTSLCCGHALIGLTDDDTVYLQVFPDHSANAGIGASAQQLQILALLFWIIHRIWIKRMQHGIDTSHNYLVGIKRVDIQHVELLVDRRQHVEILCHVEIMVVILLSCHLRRSCQQQK